MALVATIVTPPRIIRPAAARSRVDVPDSLQPTCLVSEHSEPLTSPDFQCNATGTAPRPWLVDLSGAGSSWEIILLGAATAIPIVFFFFMASHMREIYN